ncbi:hypothetical protein [Kribbia dieselivorans]|uniref:hypothetical protein n=1 Tax=Kribbia dieselivorans TaxID=331526 RepID=UPI000839835A|nr:hypothetical protein [Kribbia dieselivorans]
MTARRLAAARGIWRGRHTRTIGDEAYTVYAAVLLGLVVVAPGLRAVWIVAAGPRGVSMLTSDGASCAVAWCAAALWAGGLLLGRIRGPALLPPFPLHALTSSDITRAVTLRRPLIRSTTVIVAALTGGALLIGAALVTRSGVQLVDATAFVVAALATGIVTALTWLTGQGFPAWRSLWPWPLLLLRA